MPEWKVVVLAKVTTSSDNNYEDFSKPMFIEGLREWSLKKSTKVFILGVSLGKKFLQ